VNKDGGVEGGRENPGGRQRERMTKGSHPGALEIGRREKGRDAPGGDANQCIKEKKGRAGIAREFPEKRSGARLWEDSSDEKNLGRSEKSDRKSEILDLRDKIGTEVRGGGLDLKGRDFDNLREVVLSGWRTESGIAAHDGVGTEGPPGEDP